MNTTILEQVGPVSKGVPKVLIMSKLFHFFPLFVIHEFSSTEIKTLFITMNITTERIG